MSKQIQYIYCPDCGGTIKQEENNSFSLNSFKMPNYPRCSECGCEYQIQVKTNGTLKIKIEKVRNF